MVAEMNTDKPWIKSKLPLGIIKVYRTYFDENRRQEGLNNKKEYSKTNKSSNEFLIDPLDHIKNNGCNQATADLIMSKYFQNHSNQFITSNSNLISEMNKINQYLELEDQQKKACKFNDAQGAQFPRMMNKKN